MSEKLPRDFPGFLRTAEGGYVKGGLSEIRRRRVNVEERHAARAWNDLAPEAGCHQAA